MLACRLLYVDISLGIWLARGFNKCMVGKTNLRRREVVEKSGSKEDIVNWTFALDL